MEAPLIGILMLGGRGTRLWPISLGTNKHLLPISDKPMYFLPLTTLMLAGCRRVVLVTNPDEAILFRNFLGDGGRLGMQIEYATQDLARGIPDGILAARRYVGSQRSLLALGDNFFYGVGLGTAQASAFEADQASAVVFVKEVEDASAYAVLSLDADGTPTRIEEKPRRSGSPALAVTGLYHLPADAAELAGGLAPSQRGELEIADLLGRYVREGRLVAKMLPRGTTRTTPAGDTEALLSFGWSAASVDDSAAHQPTCAEVELPAEAWLVLRVAAATDMGEMLAALSVAEEEDPSSQSGWELLRTACEAQLAALPTETSAEAETDGRGSGASAAAALAATEARRALLKTAAAAACTACGA